MKDWGVSRQRYWGCPIPIVYDEDSNPQPIPERLLPVELPKNINLNVKGNPLDSNIDWKKITIDGKTYTRETDTLDTFVDSSWYFLRFCSNDEDKYGFNYDDINYWMPVDQYIGGVEHAILHLLYSRFFMRAIGYDKNEFKFLEPFKDYLHRAWSVTKHIEIRMVNGLVLKEVILKTKENFILKKMKMKK